jgi:hypothetical protein
MITRSGTRWCKIHSWLITHYKTYKIKCTITCSAVVKFFDIIYPVLDEAAKAGNQKQRIANTMIGMEYMRRLSTSKYLDSSIISMRKELWRKLLVVKEELLFFFYHKFIDK